MKKLFLRLAQMLADEIVKRLLTANAKVSIFKVYPGDVVVINLNFHPTIEEVQRLKDQLKVVFPDNQVIVFEKGVHLGVGRREPKWTDESLEKV